MLVPCSLRWICVPRFKSDSVSPFPPTEPNLVSFTSIYICQATWILLILHYTLLSTELIPLLEAPISHFSLRFRFPSQGALVFDFMILSSKNPLSQSPDSLFEKPFEVLLSSSRRPLHLEVLTPSSRRPHLHGVDSLLQGIYDLEVPFHLIGTSRPLFEAP